MNKLNTIKDNLYKRLKIEDKKVFSIYTNKLYLFNLKKLKLKLKKKKHYIIKRKQILENKNYNDFIILKNRLLQFYSFKEMNKKKKFHYFKSCYFNFILVYYFYNYYVLKSYHYYFLNII